MVIVSESSPAFPGNGAALEPSPWPLTWVEMLLPAGPGSGARLRSRCGGLEGPAAEGHRGNLSSLKRAARGWRGQPGGGQHLAGHPASSRAEVGNWGKARDLGPSSPKGRKDFMPASRLVHHLPRLPFSVHQAPSRLVQPGLEPGAGVRSPLCLWSALTDHEPLDSPFAHL